ncbi:4-hydroxy-tetrahydrodipicolinate reductase [Lactobacillus helsingborgensis]|uniref:4-hydroxy-tetrahydrodipicolinate reductase n=1 Tax=Lactobacillus helsingborgensis TaxID=1218494 RepID=A0AA47B3R6_9LACO|nr:4-hydroxy-tetrahydrodipicolinate reductase [Lactobacillus helsingborgensis]KJY63120.1 4-hydroxy-tetrahydrodipicolinate reductase [Lactobacillus helsingborgensis]UZX29592.1 4-hydroxy-tetrahydrodipicolinate reductase [Lactobacillus helsingborgensis]
MKKILIAGATGSMGRQAVQLVEKLPDCQLVAVLAPTASSSSDFKPDVKRFDNLAMVDVAADVWIDFTTPQAVYENTEFALKHHIRPIIGTSGLTTEQTEKLQAIAQKEKLGGIIAPNFGLSAVLLMKFAQEAARYFPDAEVIEIHHADKKDAPSATAITTAKLIAANRNSENCSQTANDSQARGADYDGVPVHSVRLPGYIAHEQVLFGGPGEALTIRQDSFSRSSFMQGVKVALDQIMNLSELVVGLDQIL